MGERHYPDQPRAYLDMDGVVADFESACTACGLDPKNAKKTPGIYRHLAVLAGAGEAVKALGEAGWLVFFLTKIPRENPLAASEKLLWVNEAFPEVGERVIISPDKGAVGEARDILIDDHPEWANARAFGGMVIPFQGDWEVVLTLAAAHRNRMDGGRGGAIERVLTHITAQADPIRRVVGEYYLRDGWTPVLGRHGNDDGVGARALDYALHHDELADAVPALLGAGDWRAVCEVMETLAKEPAKHPGIAERLDRLAVHLPGDEAQTLLGRHPGFAWNRTRARLAVEAGAAAMRSDAPRTRGRRA